MEILFSYFHTEYTDVKRPFILTNSKRLSDQKHVMIAQPEIKLGFYCAKQIFLDDLN